MAVNVFFHRVSKKRRDGNRNTYLTIFLVKDIFCEISHSLLDALCGTLLQTRHSARFSHVSVIEAKQGCSILEGDNFCDFAVEFSKKNIIASV